MVTVTKGAIFALAVKLRQRKDVGMIVTIYLVEHIKWLCPFAADSPRLSQTLSLSVQRFQIVQIAILVNAELVAAVRLSIKRVAKSTIHFVGVQIASTKVSDYAERRYRLVHGHIFDRLKKLRRLVIHVSYVHKHSRLEQSVVVGRIKIDRFGQFDKATVDLAFRVHFKVDWFAHSIHTIELIVARVNRISHQTLGSETIAELGIDANVLVAGGHNNDTLANAKVLVNRLCVRVGLKLRRLIVRVVHINGHLAASTLATAVRRTHLNCVLVYLLSVQLDILKYLTARLVNAEHVHVAKLFILGYLVSEHCVVAH
ncbi:hypothetical protein BpHYR1_005945 [Brachionus plicatilis]|uniref:Uncharacterized protein n=1 Tax=Brachionus plicatilis TaxID=10195 RepID=A0A3M7SR79_BRAPC|nr:hypothetical protein BpHYR1_005945 [Brachionus plicatilis]